MDNFLEQILKFLDSPLTDIFQLIFNKNISKVLSALTIFFIIVLPIVAVFKKFKSLYQNSNAAKNLVDFDYQSIDIKQKRELFIQTKFQNHSPIKEEEPGFSHKFVSKATLINFFIKSVFNGKKESDKFYLVLADSGMGKTTFMINLYLRYNSFWSTFLNFGYKYKMRLLHFGHSNIVDKIKEIKNDEARNTILLLDAFDEYKSLLPPEEPDALSYDQRFRKTLDEIIENVQNFREVVITSRTQYFPGQEDEPYELNIPRFGSYGFHRLAKLYLSPFDDKEITHYLHNKYGVLRFWNWKKKKTAKAIVERSPKLMVRPMLLSYIDFLVDSDESFETTYQIYEILIEKWLGREAAKRKHKKDDREKFKRDLDTFSQLAALKIYNEQKSQNMLSKEEAISICEDNNINLREYEITGQSLLTRDASGSWKFAHKSIFEFFLAREAVNNLGFFIEVWKNDFSGIDMTKMFYLERGGWAFVIKDYKTLLEKYEVLIEKALEYESEKRKDKTFIDNMRTFFHQSAIAIYSEWNKNKYLQKEQAIEIAKRNNIKLEKLKPVGNYLLTCDEKENWYFVHDSIPQLFIAKEAVQNLSFMKKIDFAGMDMTRHFYDEIVLENPTKSFFQNRNLKGEYSLKDKSLEDISSINLNLLQKIFYIKITNWKTTYNPAIFGSLKNLEILKLINTNVFDLHHLRGLSKLRVLHLSNNIIKKIDRLRLLAFDDKTTYDIELDVVDSWLKFLKNNQSLQSEVTYLTKIKVNTIVWYQSPLDVNVLSIFPFDEKLQYNIPSNIWMKKLSELRIQLKNSNIHHSITGKKKFYEQLLNSISEFIQVTVTQEQNSWAQYYIVALKKWKEQVEKELKELIAENLYSPKTALSPLYNSKVFVGRDDLVTEIRTKIQASDNMPMFLMQGQRRVGKTSLLKFLPTLLGDNFKVIYFDLQGAITEEPENCLDGIQKWLQTLREKINTNFSLSKDNWEASKDWVKSWWELMHYTEYQIKKYKYKCNIIFAFDEYEELHEHLKERPEEAKNLLGAIRNFSQHQSMITFLFAGAKFFSELTNPNWNELLIPIERIWLDYLSREYTLKLIDVVKLDYTKNIKEEIFELTQGHPELVQIICSEIVRMSNIDSSLKISKYHLWKAIENNILIPQNGIMDVFWTQFCKSRKMQKTVLGIVNGNNEDITSENIAHLLNHSFIIRDKFRFKMRVPLFEMWVKKFC